MNRLQHLPEASGSNDAHREERRVIYPVRPRDAWPRTAPDSEMVRRICVLDCETTGLDAAKHQIIELCTAIVLVNEEGRIVGIETTMTGLVDPGYPLSSEIIELTGAGHGPCAGTAAQGGARGDRCGYLAIKCRRFRVLRDLRRRYRSRASRQRSHRRQMPRLREWHLNRA